MCSVCLCLCTSRNKHGLMCFCDLVCSLGWLLVVFGVCVGFCIACLCFVVVLLCVCLIVCVCFCFLVVVMLFWLCLMLPFCCACCVLSFPWVGGVTITKHGLSCVCVLCRFGGLCIVCFCLCVCSIPCACDVYCFGLVCVFVCLLLRVCCVVVACVVMLLFWGCCVLPLFCFFCFV